MTNILRSTEKELQRKTELKMKLENEILANMQDCLLNDKAVESMANGIKKMREMSKKQVSAVFGLSWTIFFWFYQRQIWIMTNLTDKSFEMKDFRALQCMQFWLLSSMQCMHLLHTVFEAMPFGIN